MPNLVCPNRACGALTHFQPRNAISNAPNAPAVLMAQCISCQFVILLYSDTQQGITVLNYFPKGLAPAATDPAVPPPIAADFAEALKCREVHAFKATAAMCRRAVQGTAIELGAPKTVLKQQIKWLRENDKITSLLETAANQVRVFGNTGAHPGDDGLDQVTEQEADDAVDFTQELLDHVFAVAARLGLAPSGDESATEEAGG